MKCNVSACKGKRVKDDVLCKRHKAQRTAWEGAVKVLAEEFKAEHGQHPDDLKK